MLKFTALLSQEFRRSSSITIIKNRVKNYAQYDLTPNKQLTLGQEHYGCQDYEARNYQSEKCHHTHHRYASSHKMQTPVREYKSLSKISTGIKSEQQRKYQYIGNIGSVQTLEQLKNSNQGNIHTNMKKSFLCELSPNDINLNSRAHRVNQHPTFRKDQRIHEKKLQLNPKNRAFQLGSLEQIQKKIRASLKETKLKI